MVKKSLGLTVCARPAPWFLHHRGFRPVRAGCCAVATRRNSGRRFMNMPGSAGARFGGGARISRLGTSIPGTVDLLT